MCIISEFYRFYVEELVSFPVPEAQISPDVCVLVGAEVRKFYQDFIILYEENLDMDLDEADVVDGVGRQDSNIFNGNTGICVISLHTMFSGSRVVVNCNVSWMSTVGPLVTDLRTNLAPDVQLTTTMDVRILVLCCIMLQCQHAGRGGDDERHPHGGQQGPDQRDREVRRVIDIILKLISKLCRKGINPVLKKKLHSPGPQERELYQVMNIFLKEFYQIYIYTFIGLLLVFEVNSEARRQRTRYYEVHKEINNIKENKRSIKRKMMMNCMEKLMMLKMLWMMLTLMILTMIVREWNSIMKAEQGNKRFSIVAAYQNLPGGLSTNNKQICIDQIIRIRRPHILAICEPRHSELLRLSVPGYSLLKGDLIGIDDPRLNVFVKDNLIYERVQWSAPEV